MDWADWLMIALMVALIIGFILCIVFVPFSGGGDPSTTCFYMTNVGMICT